VSRRAAQLLAAAAGIALSAPAAAQQMNHMNMPGMHMPGMKMPAPKKPAPRKPGKKAAPARKPSPQKKASTAGKASKPAAAPARKKASPPKPAADPHAGHDMSSMPGMEMTPGHDMSAMPAHDMGSTPAMDMPGHDMGAMSSGGMAEAAGTNLPAGDAPPPPAPTDHAADRVYGPDAMAMGRHHLQTFHGGQEMGQVLFNLAEYKFRKGGDGFEWDGEAWYGGDINRLWLKTEGAGAFGRSVGRAEVQALYSHAIGPYFNLQGGLRYDFKPNPSRTYATVGVEGLAPSFFELEGALFLSNKGELLARAEGSYDQRITQRLILQPRVELNFAAQDSPELGTGSGLSDAEVGLRLRYDIRREFAPYLGVTWERQFGDTARYSRARGEDTGGFSFVGGVRAWF
jgi:copper resistance protein B